MRRWTLSVVVGLVVLLVVAAATVAPARDAWVLVAAAGDGSVAWLRFASGNTGLFADALTTRLVIVPPAGRGLEQRAQRGGAVEEDGGLVAGPDGFRRVGAGWAATVGGDVVQARVTVRGARDDTCPPAPGVVSGVVEFEPDGLTLDGGALVVRTHAVGAEVGYALYVPDRAAQVVVDPLAACPAWWRVGDAAWSGEPGAWTGDPTTMTIQLGARFVKVRTTRLGVDLEPFAGLLLPERLAMAAVGFGPPSEQLRRVLVDVGDGAARAGLLLVRDRAL